MEQLSKCRVLLQEKYAGWVGPKRVPFLALYLDMVMGSTSWCHAAYKHRRRDCDDRGDDIDDEWQRKGGGTSG